MKRIILILLLAASTMAASAQTPAKPATTGAVKPTITGAAKPATTGAAKKPAAAAAKLPLGVPAPGLPAVKTLKKTLFTVTLRYQEIKIGTGAVAEPNKLYKVHYTGWLAADGRKFDSSYDHPRQPLKDKDGKPVLGPDGKPQLGEAQPIVFPQGFGRVIPGWDQGFEGMKIGGQRRIFIPWRLAYGEKGRPGPDAAHPGIPEKADLIFDVELVDVTDLPKAPVHTLTPGNRPLPGVKPGTPGASASPVKPGTASAPAAAPSKPTTPAVATPKAAPTTPATPATAPAATPAQTQTK
jgi:peptidylprolyl isomerase